MSDFRALSARYAAAPQLGLDDFAAARAAGYVMVICHRPDDEEPGQLTMAQASEAAAAQGLMFRAAPYAGGLTQDAYDATMKAMAQANGPILAYCRSGTRSTIAWAFVEASRGAQIEAIVHAASAQGYDLRPHEAALRHFQEQNKG